MISIPYIVQSPVLFLVFNRPDSTRRVFQEIRSVKPGKLYIAADGPRKNNASDKNLCAEVRQIFSGIDWPCQVVTLFHDQNKGCKIAVSDAIDWFFNQEEEGIILEDDCLPGTGFFYFCDIMLEKYRENSPVYSITGTNLQKGVIRGGASYYFSNYSNIWGWASWKRVWRLYNRDLQQYNENGIREKLGEIMSDPNLIEHWMEVFIQLKAGKIDTWDYQLNFLFFNDQALCVTPNVNLVSNIGFGSKATHTIQLQDHNANLPTGELINITHPEYIAADKEADYFFQNIEFKLDEKRLKMQKDKLLRRRFKRWVRSLFRKVKSS